jgi:hypothetical protein
MTTPARNLDSLIPDDIKRSAYRFVKDLFGVPLILHDVSFTKDDRGFKATFTASEEAIGAKFFVTTRAIQAMKVGKHLMTNKLFPCTAKFITEGQAVLLVDPSTPYTPATTQEDLPF